MQNKPPKLLFYIDIYRRSYSQLVYFFTKWISTIFGIYFSWFVCFLLGYTCNYVDNEISRERERDSYQYSILEWQYPHHSYNKKMSLGLSMTILSKWHSAPLYEISNFRLEGWILFPWTLKVNIEKKNL